MNNRLIKIPGPEHPITITPLQGRVVASADGTVIADTKRALLLKESSYPAVLYIPRADANMSILERSAHGTHCPYKGEASYFSLPTGGAGRNGVWSYETPYAAVSEIKDHLAFHPDKVEIDIRA